MRSPVAMTKSHLLTGPDAPLARRLGLFDVDRLTSAIVWFSYCGLISAAITVMSW